MTDRCPTCGLALDLEQRSHEDNHHWMGEALAERGTNARYREALERIAGSSCFGKATGTDAAEWVDHQAVARQALTESGWVDPQRVRDFQAKEAK